VYVVLSLLVTVTLAACSAFQTPAPSPTLAPSPSPTATLTPKGTPTLAPTPTPARLSPAQVFQRISPAVAFIETPAGSGSGILIHDGYVVTNYHVVWPFEAVRVVFPDGSEHPDAPVLTWDPLADLALIGPIETDVPPLELVDGENLVIGSEVFFVGYPSESDKFPQPAISRGILSRVRQWEAPGITYLQSDASIAGGQSGGVLVSEAGQVIGISGYSLDDGSFGLAASALDILPRVERLMAGDHLEGIGQRRLPSSGGAQSYADVTIEHEWDNQVYVIREPIGTRIEINADAGEADIILAIWDVSGYAPVYADEETAGAETATFVTQMDAPYFVGLYQNSSSASQVSVEANHDLIPYVDLDDNRGIAPGQTVYGYLDHPGDADRFALVLKKGEAANILVDSILIDPYLTIARPGDAQEMWVSDHYSGGGLFGLNPELTFIAPETGVYLVIIGDENAYSCCGYYPQSGGYSLQVREPYAGAPTPVAPKPTLTPTPSDLEP
jgi:S1-C subfamily serine protease